MPGEESPNRVIILGALSTIGEALARHLSVKGAELVLAGRREQAISHVASNLEAQGARRTVIWLIDLATEKDTQGVLNKMVESIGGSVDAIVVIYGILGNQRDAETDQAELDRIISVNFASAARWCMAAANILERQKHGVLLAVSSVAGDRGRQSNYAYGATKAGLSILVQGLAHRLAPTGARAVVVKLGFVDTAMTAHIEKAGPLWAKPEVIARRLADMINKPGKSVVYVPWFWSLIMRVIKSLPTPIMHRTKL